MVYCGIFIFLLVTEIGTLTLSKTIHHYEDHHDEPKDYSFSYGVKDYHTGDFKNQWEKKIGDTVHGHYSMLEADGSIRIVEYTADDKTGFHATVKHEGPAFHPPIVHHAPVVYRKEPLPAVREEVKIIREEVKKPEPKTFATYYLVQDDTQLLNEKVELEEQSEEQPEVVIDHASDDSHVTLDLAQLQIEQIEQDDQYQNQNNINNFPQEIFLNFVHQANKNHSNGQFRAPEIETGFKPVRPYSKPMIPNTFITDKKPVSTPGLNSYATESKGFIKFGNRLPYTRGPVQFPKEEPEQRTAKVSGHPKPARGLIRYTKHITYFPDDDD